MDEDLLLQNLCEMSLEEGYQYLRQFAHTWPDKARIGVRIKDESMRQRSIHPLVSLKLADLLIFFGTHVEHPPSRGLGLIARGDALNYLGQHKPALEVLDEAGDLFLHEKDEVGWARSRVTWILGCAWLGRIEEALEVAARARAVFLRHNELYRACSIDHNTAIIYTQIGSYQDALAIYDRLLTIYPTLADQNSPAIKRAIAWLYGNKARNYSWLGHFEQAYSAFQKAQEIFEELGQIDDIISFEACLADLDFAQGYYGSALRRYYYASDQLIQRDSADLVMCAGIKLRMASCLFKLNRWEDACRVAEEGVTIYRQSDTSNAYTGDALRAYATTLVASGRKIEALGVLDEAIQLLDKVNFGYHSALARLQKAELLLELNRVQAAYYFALESQSYFENRGLLPDLVRLRLVMAGALIQLFQQHEDASLEEAIQLCEEIIKLADQHNLREDAYKSRQLLGHISALQGLSFEAGQYYRAAITDAEHMLDDLVSELSPSFLRTTWAIYDDMIAHCLEQGQPEEAFGYLERARSLALRQDLSMVSLSQNMPFDPGSEEARHSEEVSAHQLWLQQEMETWQERYRKYTLLISGEAAALPESEQEALKSEIRQCETRISELFERMHLESSATRVSARPRHVPQEREVDVAHLRDYLAPNHLLLAYYSYQEKLVIFAVTSTGLQVYEQAGVMEDLERLQLLLHAHLKTEGWLDQKKPPLKIIQRLLKKLYDLLISPVQALLPCDSGYVTIVPYGSLHQLPFHALYDGQLYLVENLQLNYLPASSFLFNVEHSEKKSPSPDKLPLLLGYAGERSLPRVQEEVQALTQLLCGASYLEDEATIAKLVQEAPGSPLIHLATHGKSRLDAPAFSYVRLADGQLNAIDVFSLDVKGCELVTLSGCETGLAQIGGGDEQLGLGRAFLAAGADSLVMSLWPVEDTVTNELMRLFYQYLLAGETKVQALRSAQCTLLKRTDTIYVHPYFWAAFRLVGDSRSLSDNLLQKIKSSYPDFSN